jgi:hypothetical protein
MRWNSAWRGVRADVILIDDIKLFDESIEETISHFVPCSPKIFVLHTATG